MKIEILGAETMGARSLCCYVETKDTKILIDPGVSLTPWRFGLKPHLYELAASRLIRKRILNRASDADAVVLSHYHFDHYTPAFPRLYDWSDETTATKIYSGKTIFAKSNSNNINYSQKKRSYYLYERKDCKIHEADGSIYKNLTFSTPVFHGEKDSKLGYIIMTVIDDNGERFVHASDCQCFLETTIEMIIDYKPTIVLTSGPPLYLAQIEKGSIEAASRNIAELSKHIPTLIIDHHLTRSERYGEFLTKAVSASSKDNHKIYTAAEFMQLKPCLLESRRKELHEKIPLPEDWHERFANKDEKVMDEIERIEDNILHDNLLIN
ncbi:MAG TPA: MBL fold metallo-hydrolase [Candidatus Brocadiia bacterium]|nr:MBL fold metallo-hydrolase [Planctomycetota bacterium]MBI4007849.1 MBL fold metallo-hydrolase [Planctomycetota bacterium]MDO8092521.1 MBL fold metallo-hydrolase [Candidatus Brocadiales bacterium]